MNSADTPEETIQPDSFEISTPLQTPPFPVAAIGASAGGLEAISALLENLPADSGIAYVVVQHLAPDHESLLPELLERVTSIPVHKVHNGMTVEKNNIYVIPPNTFMSILDGHLSLAPRTIESGIFLPIDYFLKSLAHVYQHKAIGILLSGTASDGTLGFKAIKEEGGITFAQDNSATFKGMPQSAIAAEVVDFILPPAGIAREMRDILKQPYPFLSPAEMIPGNEAELRKVLIILHNQKGVDFTLYKQTTINRRILRRMALNRKTKLEEYSKILRENNAEVELLFQDLLINVTSFFRDIMVFQALTKKILPALFKGRKENDIVRIWIAACATGEEAFSFAIAISEFTEANGINVPYQIFATDLNPTAIEKARAGIYMSGNLANVSPERLARFFVKIDRSFQVIKSIRDVCVFATHNLFTDPPFSKMDIVSCQNAMIYFEPVAQKKILKAFHYALKPSGVLLLGKSETTGNSADLFEQKDKELKIYTKKNAGNHFDFDFSFSSPPVIAINNRETNKLAKDNGKEWDIEKETDKLLLSAYVPASVVVNNDLQILRFHGPTSRYLQPAFGKASLSLLKMVKDDLVFELKTLILRAKKEGATMKKDKVQLIENGVVEEVNLEVVPVRLSNNEPYFLILFKEPASNNTAPEKAKRSTTHQKIKDQRIITLEHEIREAKDSSRTMSEEFEATREELQSANEEILSSNEELQSINEELETSKEELQSTNEELITINEELLYSNKNLKQAFEYREAIVETMREPLIVLNNDLCVMSANRAFYQNFLQKQDETEGSFFFEMNNGQWNIKGLRAQLLDIISQNKSFQNFEVTHIFPALGERVICFSAMRMSMGEKKENRILLVIEDITLRRKAEENLKQSVKLNSSILNSISDIFISVDNNWNFTFINAQAETFTGRKENNLIGKNLWEILTEYMDSTFHTRLISSMKTKTFSQFEFFDERLKEWYHFRIYPSEEGLTIYGNRITEQKIAQQIVEQSKERYQTFISENTEGIWRVELKKPVSVSQSKKKQFEEIYKNAYVAESNDAMAKMYYYENAAEITGATIPGLLAKNKKDELVIMKFIESGHRLTDEVFREIKDGKKYYYLHNHVGIIEDGKLVRIWGTQRDITEQKVAEKSLIKTKNQLDFALAAGSVGTFVWDLKTDQAIFSKEQSALYGMGCSTSSISGKDWYEYVHPEDEAHLKKVVEESIRLQQELITEFRIILADKSVHWILSRAKISNDKTGNPVEMSGINIDITERKSKEQIIQENEERFRALVQNAFDVITVFNVDGNITYQSDSLERVLGYTVEERIGKNIFQQSLVHPDDREIERKLFQKCLEKPYTHVRGEFRMIHKNGDIKIMEVGCINLPDNSSIHGIIKNYRDITERHMLEKQKEEFIAIASHELKTPVTSIKAYTQILYESLLEKQDNSSATLLSKMDGQIDRLTNLIKDLLDVTKITESKLMMKYEKYDMNELINEVAEDMQLTTKKHEIIKELGNIKPITGDRERTAQVIVNLLSNAIKYSPHTEKIFIRTTGNDEEVSVCVQDFGIGISEQMQKNLFKRFFRVMDDSTRTFPGLGLGLFIAAEIINRQHGHIWVTSAPNEGSTFCFTLPFEN